MRPFRQFARVAAALAALAMVFAPASLWASCPAGVAEEEVRLVAILQDGTLQLADGRHVRQPELLFVAPLAHADMRSISNMVPGGEAILRLLSKKTDRWARYHGHLLSSGAAGQPHDWLARRIAAHGLAIVSPVAGSEPQCAERLLQAEREARAARIGIWQDIFVQSVSDLQLGGREGEFVLVEGRVRSVRRGHSRMFVNFSYNWATDFTATIPLPLPESYSAAGLEPRSLEGRRVRLRGRIQLWNGPAIELQHPAQIEFLSGAGS